MSWDVNLYAPTECGQLTDVGRRNYTWNVSPMYYDALGGDGLSQFGRMNAKDALPILKEGVRKMKESPEKYREMNPPNGWGNYEGALDLLEWMLKKCEEYPSIEISIF